VIYEMRSYEVVPGKMPEVHARVQNHTIRFMQKHGIEPVGFWEAAVGESGVLHYIVKFDDFTHFERSWASMRADGEWLRVLAESNKDGQTVARVRNQIWRPTAYSPLR